MNGRGKKSVRKDLGAWRIVYWNVLGLKEPYLDWIERIARDPVQALGFVMDKTEVIKKAWVDRAGKDRIDILVEIEVLGKGKVLRVSLDEVWEVDDFLAALGEAIEQEVQREAANL